MWGTREPKLPSDYFDHPFFKDIEEIMNFYNGISYTTMNFMTRGTTAILNMDTYLFSSLHGTLSSIKLIVSDGRLNDAYALLRKFQDLGLINIYCNLYLEENIDFENIFVAHINDWLHGKKAMEGFAAMKRYIDKSALMKPLMQVLYKDDRYDPRTNIRKRSNEHMHYNSYSNAMLNDSELYLQNRMQELSQFHRDLLDLFIFHFSCLFYLNEHYLLAPDHLDHLELGYPPPEGSENWVPDFIQAIFDNIVKSRRKDVAEAMLGKISMDLK